MTVRVLENAARRIAAMPRRVTVTELEGRYAAAGIVARKNAAMMSAAMERMNAASPIIAARIARWEILWIVAIPGSMRNAATMWSVMIQ